MKKFNPFLTSGYISPDYLCDREEELIKLNRYLKNRNNVSLISPRRLGKTGLILRLFDELEREGKYYTLYVDIFSTRNLKEFIRTLSETVLQKFPEKTSIGKMFWNFLKGLRPLIKFDNLTGQPQIEITYQLESEKVMTLKNILQFLENLDKPIIIAIDEFQQIREYPEENMEAILRTEIQHLQNISFLFSGSKRSIMTDIFFNAKSPFYNSSSFMSLEKIEQEKYAEFIKHNFEKEGFIIDKPEVDYILQLTQGYTYYTQSLCNKLFYQEEEKIDNMLIESTLKDIIEENAAYYLQIRSLLTTTQWNYLIAIAKEEKVEQPTAGEFLLKYKIGGAGNSRRLLLSLIEKELILETHHKEEKFYQIYDLFFHHFLRENY